MTLSTPTCSVLHLDNILPQLLYHCYMLTFKIFALFDTNIRVWLHGSAVHTLKLVSYNRL